MDTSSITKRTNGKWEVNKTVRNGFLLVTKYHDGKYYRGNWENKKTGKKISGIILGNVKSNKVLTPEKTKKNGVEELPIYSSITCIPMTQEIVNDIIQNVLLDTPINFSIDDIRNAKNVIKKSNPYRLYEYQNETEFLSHLISNHSKKSWESSLGTIYEKIQIALSGGIKVSEIGVDYFIPPNKYFGAKSGPNWANSDQRKSMEVNASKLKSEGNEVFVISIYGNSHTEYRSYTQLCGKEGLELITDDPDMYQKVFVAFRENQEVFNSLKDNLFKNLENEVLNFWTDEFYTDNTFDEIKYLNYVSKKLSTRKKSKN